MTAPHDVTAALRLGWAVAEARGRAWPGGPKPALPTQLPQVPQNLLPLRSQRDLGASLDDAVRTMVGRARALRLAAADDLERWFTGAVRDDETWARLAKPFVTSDGELQDQLGQRDDNLANAYLLGRGLAECYWGLGPSDQWTGADGRTTGVGPAYLFGEERRVELSRMLGRLKSAEINPLSVSAIDGSLESWAAVAANPRWSAVDPLGDRLYEQARVWYQLLVLGQDPTTLIRPGARLGGLHYLTRSLAAFWAPAVVALVALVFGVVVVAVRPVDGLVSSLLATGGFGALAVAGLLARGRSVAQQVVTRLRQDSYTDLVALAVTKVPERPRGVPAPSLLTLVGRRLLTPPTPAPR